MRELRWFTPLFLIISATFVATSALGYYSYRTANRLAALSEHSVKESNHALGVKIIDRIEKVIIDNGRAFFRLVQPENPREFKELWRRIIRVSPMIESVTVLGPDFEILHLVAKQNRKEQAWFRDLMTTRIIPDMDLQGLPLEQHRHLHKTYGGKSYLLAYIRSRSDEDEQDYYFILNYNIRYLVDELIRKEFSEIEASNWVSVIEQEGRVLYGQPVEQKYDFVFEGRFPTTLYRWSMQLAPRQMTTIKSKGRARQLSDLSLIGVALGVIMLGMTVLVVAARKERKANQLKSLFISNVSHELKTPLSLIRMFGELIALRGSEQGVTVKEYAEIIMRESERLTHLIDNVLDFARMERGKISYNFELLNVGTIVTRAVELLKYRCDKAQIELSLQIDEALPQTLADESALTLVVMNLIENAVKYGSPRGGKIWVSVGKNSETSPEEMIVIRVKDEGPGVSADDQKRIFERFYRGETARRGSSRGSGIGLSLVKLVCDAHEGRVTVESVLGQGATFSVYLPIRTNT